MRKFNTVSIVIIIVICMIIRGCCFLFCGI